MQKVTIARKLRILIVRIVLFVVGVAFILIGLGAGTKDDASIPLLIFAGCGVGMGLFQLYLGIFGSDTAAVGFLASVMESE